MRHFLTFRDICLEESKTLSISSKNLTLEFLDIYLVRELKEWKLEEDLMAKLIYLYRSPETMLRVTKLRPYKPKIKQIKQD